MIKNKDKIILDLCGGTGAWSKPYKDAGYDVRIMTLPEDDVTQWHHNSSWFPEIEGCHIYGILAAPPCTMFSYARTNAKLARDLREGMRIVHACLDIIWRAQYQLESKHSKVTPLKFWALENPYGMLRLFLGKPVFEFNPYDFGDGYKKRTQLWGNFNEPVKNSIKCDTVKFDMMASKDIHPEQFGKLTRQERRAITPQGFARAFMEANK